MPLNRRQFLMVPPVAAAAAAVWPRGAAASGARAGAIDWAALRAELTTEPDLAYLNWGTYGPPARSVAEIETRDRETMRANYNRHFASRFPAAAIVPVVERVAGFLGVSPDDLAFTSGATEAMNTIAFGLDLEPGDEILTTEHEHQAGIYPYLMLAKRRGVTVRQIPMPAALRTTQQFVDHLEAAIAPRTRVLSFCHIQYTDGLILPAKELCAMARRRGVLSIVDGAQAVGLIDVNVADLGCDCYAASLHKWLGAPYGTGFFTVRRDLRSRLWPSVVEGYEGWDSTDRYGTTNPGVDFAAGWPAALVKYSVNFRYYVSAFWAVTAAIEQQERLGRASILGRVRALVARLRAGLMNLPRVEIVTPESPALSAGLVSFRTPGVDTAALFFALSRQDRVVTRYVRHAPIGFDVLRASVHAFNTEDEIDRLLDALKKRLA